MHSDHHHPEQQGVVYKKTSGRYEVFAGDKRIACQISAKLLQPTARSKGKGHGKQTTAELASPIAVGDQVSYIAGPDGMGIIVSVLPRRNSLSRETSVSMPGAHAFEQTIAANVDLVVPVFAAAKPTPRWNMLDRCLVAAESMNIPALICITKLDLLSGAERDELESAVEEYCQIGYPVVLCSACTGEGMDELRSALSGKISALIGKSGVGKSTLLNALLPSLDLRVNQVNQVTGKGRHTTTHQEMYPLPSGGAIVDTPGVREFGLWDITSDDLAYYFPEIRPHIGRCRFGMNCAHDEEPGCAVRKAVMRGEISPRRYQNYMRLKAEIEVLP